MADVGAGDPNHLEFARSKLRRSDGRSTQEAHRDSCHEGHEGHEELCAIHEGHEEGLEEAGIHEEVCKVTILYEALVFLGKAWLPNALSGLAGPVFFQAVPKHV